MPPCGVALEQTEDALVALFEVAGLKHASRSHLQWWLEHEGASSSLASKVTERLLREQLWEPFDGESRLTRETRRVRAGYRDAARTIRAVTLHPTKRSLVLSLVLIAILPVWIGYLFAPGGGAVWARVMQALIFGLPPFVAGALRLARFLRPDRIQIEHERARAMRGRTLLAEIQRDAIAFIGVAQMGHETIHEASKRLPRSRLAWLTAHYQSGSWAVYAKLADDSVVVLADHLDVTTARATALLLEDELELLVLVREERVQARVEVDSAVAEHDEAIAAGVEDGADGDPERSAAG